jgi:4-hydroxybenzoate polyprenyltransferase
VFGYSLVTETIPTPIYILFLAMFSVISHIYTALGDIEYDKKSSIYTTAVLFKSDKNNLLICIAGMATLVICMYVLLPISEKLYALPLILYVLFFVLHAVYRHPSMTHIWYSWFIRLHYIVGLLYTIILIY